MEGIAPTFGSLAAVEMDMPTAGRSDDLVVQMTTIGEVEASGKLMISFPSGYDLTNAQASTPTGRLWLAESLQVEVNQTGVSCDIKTDCGGGILKVFGFKTIAPGQLTFTLRGRRVYSA